MSYFHPKASLTAQAVDGKAATPAPSSPAIESDKQPAGPVNLAKALATKARLRIDAPRIEGSINLVGARIDDIELRDYRETIDKDSGPVQLFHPPGTELQYYAPLGLLGRSEALAIGKEGGQT